MNRLVKCGHGVKVGQASLCNAPKASRARTRANWESILLPFRPRHSPGRHFGRTLARFVGHAPFLSLLIRTLLSRTPTQRIQQMAPSHPDGACVHATRT